MPTILEKMQGYLDAGNSPKDIKASFLREFGVPLKSVPMDADFDQLKEARDRAKGLAQNVLEDGLRSAGMDVYLDPKEAARGSIKPLPAPAEAPARGQDPGQGILAGGRDPAKDALAAGLPRGGAKGEPVFERKKLVWEPLENIAGLTVGMLDASKEGTFKAAAAEHAETQRRKGMDFQQAAETDIAETLASPFMLLMQIAGPRYIDPSTETTRSAAAKEGKEIIEGVGGSTLAATTAALEGDWRAFAARPLSTALTAIPAARGVTRVLPQRMVAPVRTAATAVKKQTTALSEKIHQDVTRPIGPAAPAIVQVVGGVIDKALGAVLTEEGRAGVVRMITDGLHQADPRATALVQTIVQDPQNAAASLKADFERLGHRVAAKKKVAIAPVDDPEIIAKAQEITSTPRIDPVDVDKAKTASKVHEAVAEKRWAQVTRPVAIDFVADDGTKHKIVSSIYDSATVAQKLRDRAAHSPPVPVPVPVPATKKAKKSKTVEPLTHESDFGVLTPAEASRALALVEAAIVKQSVAKIASIPKSTIVPLESSDPPVRVRLRIGGKVVEKAIPIADAPKIMAGMKGAVPATKRTKATSAADNAANRTAIKQALRSATEEKSVIAVQGVISADRAAAEAAQQAANELWARGIDLPPPIATGLGKLGGTIDVTPEAAVASVAPKTSRVFPSPASPEQLRTGAYRAAISEYADDVLVDIRKQAEALDPDLAERLKHEKRDVADEVLTATAEAMAGETDARLRHKPIRDAVAKAAVEQLVRDGRVLDHDAAQLSKQLSDSVGDALGMAFTSGDKPRTLAGFSDPAVKDAWDQSVKENIGGEVPTRVAVAAVAQDLSRDLEKGAMTRGIAAEANVVGETIESAVDVVVNRVRSKDLTPQILPETVDPKVLAKHLVDKHPGDAQIAAVAKQIAAYERLDGDLLGFRGWAKPSIRESLETHARARAAFYNDDILTNIIRAQKAGYVPRNLTSIVNNYLSNEAFEWWSRANPLGTAQRLARVVRYAQFMRGKLTGPDVPMMKAISRTGIVETSRLAADIGAINGLADIGKGIPGVKQLNELLEASHQMGDQVFKVSEAITNYLDLEWMIKALEPGNQFSGNAGSRKIQFGKTPEGDVTVTDLTSTTTPVPRVVSGEDLYDIMAEVAVTPAKRKFIDYSRIPGGLQRLKAGPFRGLGSGFATWLAGATDIPGVKKGLGHALLTESMPIQTNSPKILWRLAKQDGFLAIQRGLFLSMAGNEKTGAEAQELGKAFNFNANESRPQITQMIDGDTIAAMDLRGVDFLSGSKLAARIGTSMGVAMAAALASKSGTAAEALLDRVTSEGADPRLWSIYTKLLAREATGQIANPSDVLTLISLGGSTILDTWQQIKETEEAGKVMHIPAVLEGMLTPFLGATAAKMAGVAGDASVEFLAGEGTPSKARMRTLSTSEPTNSQDFLRFAIRHLTGRGFTEKALVDASPQQAFSLFSKYKKEWKASLRIRQTRQEGEALVALGESRDDDAMERRGEALIDRSHELDAIVDETIDEMYDYWQGGGK